MDTKIVRVLPISEHEARIVHIRNYIIGHWRISPEEAEPYLRVSFGNQLPQAWVAIAPDRSTIGHAVLAVEPAGFLGIENQPWLMALFMDEAWRYQGTGGALVRYAERAARDAGYRRLYLDTIGGEAFYAGRGWVRLGEDVWGERGERVIIMAKDL